MPSDAPFASVQEADAGDSMAVLKVRAPGITRVLLVAALPGLHAALVLTPDARRAAFGGRVPPGHAVSRARGAPLVGARVTGVGDRHVALVLTSGEVTALAARAGRVVLGPPRDGVEARPLASDPALEAEWAARAEVLLPRLAELAVDAERARGLALLARARAVLHRRARAVEGDLARIEEVLALAARGPWLEHAARAAPRGARSIEAVDWTSGEAAPISLPLDPARPALEQLLALYARAKRLRAGRAVAAARLDATLRAGEALDAAARALGTATSIDAVKSALVDAKAAAPREVRLERAAPEAAAPRGAARRPFRGFTTPEGAEILVGRGGHDNDELTWRVASPHDLWLHAKDRPGAHVVLRLARGAQPTPTALADAAHLAAHFSDARGEAVVDVQYTPRKHLRRPRAGAPGAVIVERERVIALRADDARREALLAREEDP